MYVRGHTGFFLWLLTWDLHEESILETLSSPSTVPGDIENHRALCHDHSNCKDINASGKDDTWSRVTVTLYHLRHCPHTLKALAATPVDLS